MKTPPLLTKYRIWLISTRGLNMLYFLSITTIHFTQMGMVGWPTMCNGPRLILGLRLTICNCNCNCDFWMSLENETRQNENESIMTMRSSMVGELEWTLWFVIDLNSGHLNEHPCMKLGLESQLNEHPGWRLGHWTLEWTSTVENWDVWPLEWACKLKTWDSRHLNNHPRLRLRQCPLEWASMFQSRISATRMSIHA